MCLCFVVSGNVLFYCVSAGQLKVFLRLLELGVQIETDMDGMSLLMEAAYEGHLDTVRYLVSNARDLRITINQTDNARRSALFYAFENSQLPVVQFLLSHGARLEPADHNKNVLMCACLKNNITVLKYCLENLSLLNLTLDDVDDKGRNVLFYAVTGGNSEALELLIQAGACVHSSPDGINLLMQAAGKKQLDVGRFVIQVLRILAHYF